jgi:hypothetical protein
MDVLTQTPIVVLWVQANMKRSSKIRHHLTRKVLRLVLLPKCFQGFSVPGQGKGILKIAYMERISLPRVGAMMVCLSLTLELWGQMELVHHHHHLYHVMMLPTMLK